jgi:hypothetical protein
MDKKLEKYLLFVYPAYVICFMGVIGIFVEVFGNIPTPEFLKIIFKISAVWSLTAIYGIAFYESYKEQKKWK